VTRSGSYPHCSEPLAPGNPLWCEVGGLGDELREGLGEGAMTTPSRLLGILSPTLHVVLCSVGFSRGLVSSDTEPFELSSAVVMVVVWCRAYSVGSHGGKLTSNKWKVRNWTGEPSRSDSVSTLATSF
jgi:hypothetical protein